MAGAVRISAVGGSSTGTADRTATITPASGDLLVVYCCVAANTNDTPTCSDNNGSGAYDRIDILNFAIAAVNYRLSVFIRTALMVNTTSTVVTVATGSNTSGTIHVLAHTGVVRVGSDAVRSKGSQNNQAAGTAAPTLNQAALTGNPTLVAHGSADTTTTPPTNWTEIQDTNFANDTVALETAFRASGFTGTTITFGAASSTQFCAHAMELDTTAPLTQSPTDSVDNLVDVTGLGYGNLHVDSVNVLADAAQIVLGYRVGLADSANNLADGEVQVIGTAAMLADSLATLADAQAQLLVYLLAFADTTAANWADAHQLLLSQRLALADDSFNAADAASLSVGQPKPLTDSLPDLTDDVTYSLGLQGVFSDALALSDSIPATSGGLNFRATSGFVVDGAEQTYVLADDYPTVRDGLTFGYEGGSGGNVIKGDRSSSVDVRLAGSHAVLNSDETPITFRVDLPSPGVYQIRLASGDALGVGRTYIEIRDDTTPFVTLGPLVTGAGEFADAEGTGFDATDWPADNVAVEHEFTSSILRFQMSGTADLAGISRIAHLSFSSAGGGAADPPLLIGYGLLVADAVAISDFPSLGHGLLVNDALTLADSVVVQLLTSEIELHLDDQFAITDSVSVQLNYFVQFADALVLAESAALQLGQRAAFSDSLAFTDSATIVLGYAQSANDALTLTDAATSQIAHLLAFADTVTLTDSETLGVGLVLTDSAAILADAIALRLHQSLDFSDSLVLADGQLVTLGHNKQFTDSIDNLVDSEVHQLDQRLSFSDSVASLADAYAQTVGESLSFSNALTPTDSLALGYGLVITDAASFLLDDIVTSAPQGPLRQMGVTDALDALADEIALRLGHLLAVVDTAATLADAAQLLEGLRAAFADSLTLTDAATVNLDHRQPLADSLTFTDSIQLRLDYQLGASDTLVLTDSATQSLSYHLALADNAALLADSATQTIGLVVIIVDNGPTFSDAVALFSAGLLQLADALTLTDSLAKFGAGFLPLDDALVIIDSAIIELRGPDLSESPADSLTFTDAISLTLGNELRLQLQLVDTVTLADHYFDLRHPYTPSAKRHIVVPSRPRTTVPVRRQGIEVPRGDRTTVIE